jgi:peroxiredoxin Q/BCP
MDDQAQTAQRAQRRAQVGDPAPDIALPNATGEIIRLSDYRGKREVILYFYPKDFTSGCTAEACSFRDNYDEILALGAEVIGVSADSQSSHQDFAEKHHLPFPLLSDTDGVARRAFDVPTSLGIIPGRVTYVIDRQGIIRHIFTSQLNINKHIADALATLRQLSGAQG